ncbi:hypothetical protein BDV18DRAFT_158961 [Aspergillus unguis]
MDALLSKKTAMKRRASLSLLFGSQKPTFANPDEKPSRYYDFVDTPTPTKIKRNSEFISRQELSPELESKVRYACSLLAYRIEHGVPAPSNNYNRPISAVGIRRNNTSEAQVASKCQTLKARPGSPFVNGYDSGVGLTQQPSMQTMRALNSRSGEPSDAGDTRTVSIFSNTRTGTSCSNTTEPSCIQSSAHSPRQNENELQSITGANITDCMGQTTSTKVFLTESVKESDPPPYRESINPNPEDTENFLNPTSTVTNLSAETLSSHPSPSLGLSRFPGLDDDSTFSSPHLSSERAYLKNRSIIIDSSGQARLLTPDQESQRNKVLQKAVLAKMRPGFMGQTTACERSQKEPKKKQQQDSPDKSCSIHQEHDPKPQLPRSTSKLGLAWARRKDQIKASQKLRDAVPLVGKLGKLFSRERSE